MSCGIRHSYSTLRKGKYFVNSFDPKKAWRRLSELGGYNDRSGQSGPAIIKDENGRLLTEVNDVGAALGSSFSKVSSR